jgi:hypothetical protein
MLMTSSMRRRGTSLKSIRRGSISQLPNNSNNNINSHSTKRIIR